MYAFNYSCCCCGPLKIFSDRLSGCSDGRRTQGHSDTLFDTDRCSLRSPSVGLHLASQVGHDWLDDLLHPCDSRVLVPPPAVLVLEDG